MIRYVLTLPPHTTSQEADHIMSLWRAASSKRERVDVAIQNGIVVQDLGLQYRGQSALVRRARALHR